MLNDETFSGKYFFGIYIIYMTATFTFEALPDESPEHLPAVVAEGGRFVGVDVKRVRSDLEIFYCSLSWNQNAT